MMKAKNLESCIIDSDLMICGICKEIFNPDMTVELDCKHMFCEDCLRNSNFENVSLTIYDELTCPLCNMSQRYEKIKKCNRFAYNIIYNTKVKCPNTNCNQIIQNGELSKHMLKCEYKLMDCPYCDTTNIFRKDLKTHLVDNMSEHFLSLIDEVENLKNKKIF